MPHVSDLTPHIRRKRILDRFEKWKRSSQGLLCSLIQKTGKDSCIWISGYRYSRARNGEHSHNPIWLLKLLLAEQWFKGRIREEDLTKATVHFMSFFRQLKGLGDAPPCQDELREEAREHHAAVQELMEVLFHAASDGVIDAEEGPNLIEVLETLEADARDLRFKLQHAHHSNALPEVASA